MRSILALAAAATMTSACVIIVDGDDDWDDDHDRDSYQMGLAAEVAGPLNVAETQTLSPIKAVSAASGTDVTIVPGPAYEIRLDQRAVERTRFEVKGSNLEIACQRPCGNGPRGRVEVVMPSIEAISVSSGAHLEVADGFDGAGSLQLSASSGARLNAKMLEADRVNASVSSGASIQLSADESLNASASSGGRIRYQGDPEDVAVSQSSGGSIKRQ